MRLIIDIDGTICSHEQDYRKAKPFKNRIAKVNRFYDSGSTIIYFTARGTKTSIDYREITEAQFKRWGVKYHELLFNKPYGDFYVDDKGVDDMWLGER